MKLKTTRGLKLFAAALGAAGLFTMAAYSWQSDNGNGTFKNPVLYADYADPDIIRVTNDFYMVSTTFVDSPGITVLHSQDLVNWEIASHCATNLDGGNAYNLIGGTAYQSGFWASSIRYYNGTFYVVANPTFANSRIYYATNAAGPWQYYQLNQVTYDPGLFIDANGAGYIVAGHGPQSVFVLNPGFSQIVAVSNNVVNSGGEGSHLVRRGSYFYLFNANPGVWPYQLRCSRATNIFGPWETGHICLTATTGGHQGSIVDINDSDQWFGFVHQDSGSIGRMPRIGPVFWENNWPVFGTIAARDQLAASYAKPVAGQPLLQPATSDEFTNAAPGPQWQWNHNPDNARWSLTERPGYLRLKPTLAPNFWVARNTLTQKGQGPLSYGIVKLDLANLQAGDVAGFGTLGKVSAHIAVSVGAGGVKTLTTRMIKDQVGSYAWATGVTIAGNTLYLRTDLNFTNNLGICSYSTNGTTWTTLGGNFALMWGYGSTFQGEKFALFCYNTNTASSAGYVDVDSFTFGETAPLVTLQRGRPHINAAHSTFVGDNGQPLRGPYTSTEWTTATSPQNIANMKNLGFNAVHLYAESFDPSYPTNGSTAPGYHLAEVDKIVAETRTNGLYLVMTIGNGANNGAYNRAWITNFWNLYGARYANETHVLYEIQNEPVAWGPSYLTANSPPGGLDMEVAAYQAIRAVAPDSPVLLFSYAVLGGTGGASAALTDIHAFNQTIFGAQNAVWTNVAVGFHGYAGASGTAVAVSNLISAGYPCLMTEFGDGTWGGGLGGLDVEGVANWERLGVSWLTFAYVPPSGVSDDVTRPDAYLNRVVNSGLSWMPDYGGFPAVRGVYGNGGYPWTTPGYVNNVLGGTLRIEAENFDNGGRNVAYHNANSTNPGGQYRTGETVGIEAASDAGGGYDVGWNAAGDWLEYTLKISVAGTYTLRLRVAGAAAGSVQVLAYNNNNNQTTNGVDLTGPWTLPNTGGNQTWQTATRSVFLAPGQQRLRINVLAAGFNLNWIELSPAAAGPIANGTYKFVNAANALALDLNANNVVVSATPSSSTKQQWNLRHLGGGNYQVSPAAGGNSWDSGTPLHLSPWGWAASGSSCFLLLPTGGGYYRFFSAGGGTSFATVTGTNILSSGIYSGAAQQQWAIGSPAAPLFPTGLSATAGSATQVTLAWNAVPGATSYNIKRASASGGPYTTLASGLLTTNYTDTVPAGAKFYYVAAAVSGGVESANSLEATVNLPFPWLTQDVGAPGVAGSASFGNGMFTATGSGGDIWNTSDAFRFVYVPVTGNGTIIARVTAVQNIDAWSKAGVMIRESLAGNAINAFIAVTPGNGVTWQTRSTTGGSSGNAATGGLIAPYWVKLVRSGNTFTGYRSPDGVTWTQQGTATITMAAAAYIGLALTSHNNSSLCTATFDNVTAPGWAASFPPPAPVGLIATPGNGQAALTWLAASSATSYNVKRSITNGGPYAVLSTVTATNFTDTGLANGSNYYYVVSALNLAGESTNSAQASATPQGLVPAGLSAAPVSASQISLVWNTLTNGATYNVKRSTTNGGPYTVVAGGVTATNYLDSGLAGGTIYYYVVSAVVSGSETPNSAQAAATTMSPVHGSLVHRYSFSETGGTTVADSIGGPVWNGTLPGGGTLGGGQLALAANSQQYASLPPGILGSLSNFTVVAWVNLTSTSNWSRIFDFGNNTTTNMFLTPQNGTTGTLRFAITTNGGGNEQQINCGSTLTTGVWHQVVVTLNGTTGVLALDGVAVGTNSGLTIKPASLGGTANNYIGKSQYPDPGLDGRVDEFCIYSAALSPAEIAATYALGPDQLLSTNCPPMSMAMSGTDTTLSWPLASAGYTLQSRTNLMVGNWLNVAAPAPQIVGSQWQVALPLSVDGNPAFYRLSK
jgi:endoglucanase